ncbi:MAG: DNA helicase RecG, partial [Paenibacillaceae bacterium]|nr:DNA helicase RecG [Paenibacillaceae bacterium]
FVEGVLAMLVATTVIEVGVDVPNATMIVVYNAERFGLAQLHQLRGRVGRGAYASTCIVLSDAHTVIARKRLRTFVSTTDGFALARQDLALRGPGDVFGTQQSGLPKFRIGDIEQDFPLLEAARDDASALLAEASFWTDPQYAALRDQLSRAGVPMD